MRGAGEVAPRKLVGVVKHAPELPLDGTFPFLHLDRQFMHLGFHIYDLAFQSPNVEAARPLVYASALLLVLMIVLLNLGAVLLRAYLRGRHRDPLG
jgi:phosphate transport system permease protein